MVYYLVNFELQIESYDFSKIRTKSDSNFYLNSILNQRGPRGATVFVGTSSGGSALRTIWILVDLGGQDKLIPLRVSDLLGTLGSRSDGEKIKKRKGAHLGFTVDRRWQGHALEVDVAGDSGVSGDGEGADELQHGAVITRVWSPSSFASYREGGERLEWPRVEASFGCLTNMSIPCEIWTTRRSGRCAALR
jgi:hypothetical protein